MVGKSSCEQQIPALPARTRCHKDIGDSPAPKRDVGRAQGAPKSPTRGHPAPKRVPQISFSVPILEKSAAACRGKTGPARPVPLSAPKLRRSDPKYQQTPNKSPRGQGWGRSRSIGFSSKRGSAGILLLGEPGFRVATRSRGGFGADRSPHLPRSPSSAPKNARRGSQNLVPTPGGATEPLGGCWRLADGGPEARQPQLPPASGENDENRRFSPKKKRGFGEGGGPEGGAVPFGVRLAAHGFCYCTVPAPGSRGCAQ